MPPSDRPPSDPSLAVTVGVDIGTTSVKAVAADGEGRVVARTRVPHRILHETADHLEHDAGAAWRRGPRRAVAALRSALADGPRIAGICVAGMVPSLTAVDRRGTPRTPGLLYGDLRGRGDGLAPPDDGRAGPMPDAEGFLRWTVAEAPGAHGYWPAQAVATHALTGHAAIDTAVSSTLGDLQRAGRWNTELLEELGVVPAQLPRVVPTGRPAGTVRLDRLGTGRRAGGGRSPTRAPGGSAPVAAAGGREADDEVVVAPGTIDAFCDQLVAGATQVGDVLVIFGATLITWVVTDEWVEAPGLWTVPHTVAGRVLIGGPSNAGALFVNWARSLLPTSATRGPAAEVRTGRPESVPVWLPYLRGERVPYHDTGLRSGLLDLDITSGPPALARAAYEASGFVIRRILDASGVAGRRVVASGGGTQLAPWMSAVADATGLPVETVAVPEGAALGAAFLARMAAGLEPSLDGSARWVRPGRRFDPDPVWRVAAEGRYRRFCELGAGH